MCFRDAEPEEPTVQTETDIREKEFHNNVRELIIFLLLFQLLYISSYALISLFKRKVKDECVGDDDDEALVYKISIGLCTCSLAVSAGAVLLLPISIVSNEILLYYPKSYYVQWLNSSLIQGLWNLIFLFSNVSLFVLLPFAYFFIESEGFSGFRKGIMARVYEAMAVLLLLSLLVLGMAYILAAVIYQENSSLQSLFSVWSHYLPFIYSCVSFVGVLMLLLCTPIGFGRLFGVVGSVMVQPQFFRDIDEEYYAACFEEQNLKMKISSGYNSDLSIQNGIHSDFEIQLVEVEKQRIELERRKGASRLQRNFVYPSVMLLLLAITSIAALLVGKHFLQLIVGLKQLPATSQEFVLGLTSISVIGPVGAAVEIVIIFYLILTSLVGFYALPWIERFQPKKGDTPLTHLIFNCAVVLILSSALPLLARTLGITNFDLIGEYAEVEWLGNFYVIIFYNIVFTVLTVLSLFNKFTSAIREELFRRLGIDYYLGRFFKRKNVNGVGPNGEVGNGHSLIGELNAAPVVLADNQTNCELEI